ncbi:hypothetical protein ABPG74_004349 [Tetrahymena malaccensis]
MYEEKNQRLLNEIRPILDQVDSLHLIAEIEVLLLYRKSYVQNQIIEQMKQQQLSKDQKIKLSQSRLKDVKDVAPSESQSNEVDSEKKNRQEKKVNIYNLKQEENNKSVNSDINEEDTLLISDNSQTGKSQLSKSLEIKEISKDTAVIQKKLISQQQNAIQTSSDNVQVNEPNKLNVQVFKEVQQAIVKPLQIDNQNTPSQVQSKNMNKPQQIQSVQEQQLNELNFQIEQLQNQLQQEKQNTFILQNNQNVIQGSVKSEANTISNNFKSVNQKQVIQHQNYFLQQQNQKQQPQQQLQNSLNHNDLQILQQNNSNQVPEQQKNSKQNLGIVQVAETNEAQVLNTNQIQQTDGQTLNKTNSKSLPQKDTLEIEKQTKIPSMPLPNQQINLNPTPKQDLLRSNLSNQETIQLQHQHNPLNNNEVLQKQNLQQNLQNNSNQVPEQQYNQNQNLRDVQVGETNKAQVLNTNQIQQTDGQILNKINLKNLPQKDTLEIEKQTNIPSIPLPNQPINQNSTLKQDLFRRNLSNQETIQLQHQHNPLNNNEILQKQNLQQNFIKRQQQNITQENHYKQKLAELNQAANQQINNFDQHLQNRNKNIINAQANNLNYDKINSNPQNISFNNFQQAASIQFQKSDSKVLPPQPIVQNQLEHQFGQQNKQIQGNINTQNQIQQQMLQQQQNLQPSPRQMPQQLSLQQQQQLNQIQINQRNQKYEAQISQQKPQQIQSYNQQNQSQFQQYMQFQQQQQQQPIPLQYQIPQPQLYQQQQRQFQNNKQEINSNNQQNNIGLQQQQQQQPMPQQQYNQQPLLYNLQQNQIQNNNQQLDNKNFKNYIGQQQQQQQKLQQQQLLQQQQPMVLQQQFQQHLLQQQQSRQVQNNRQELDNNNNQINNIGQLQINQVQNKQNMEAINQTFSAVKNQTDIDYKMSENKKVFQELRENLQEGIQNLKNKENNQIVDEIIIQTISKLDKEINSYDIPQNQMNQPILNAQTKLNLENTREKSQQNMNADEKPLNQINQVLNLSLKTQENGVQNQKQPSLLNFTEINKINQNNLEVAQDKQNMQIHVNSPINDLNQKRARSATQNDELTYLEPDVLKKQEIQKVITEVNTLNCDENNQIKIEYFCQSELENDYSIFLFYNIEQGEIGKDEEQYIYTYVIINKQQNFQNIINQCYLFSKEIKQSYIFSLYHAFFEAIDTIRKQNIPEDSNIDIYLQNQMCFKYVEKNFTKISKISKDMIDNLNQKVGQYHINPHLFKIKKS